ncbi:Hypothetical predicted protein [Marmota monax]|uniref:Uncharacterized protein n=1 Tax=Marmota monax TaxID=9995 RepID=A0A5E4BFZ3_MARMO|nr:hypothetical protein GHT09_003892 [Marmota monax]VTJ68613.1 Hypothetical predicted protein [Marmota monax]
MPQPPARPPRTGRKLGAARRSLEGGLGGAASAVQRRAARAAAGRRGAGPTCAVRSPPAARSLPSVRLRVWSPSASSSRLWESRVFA